MSDVIARPATSLAKQGEAVHRSLIGTAIGGLSGKALEALADAFGVPGHRRRLSRLGWIAASCAD